MLKYFFKRMFFFFFLTNLLWRVSSEFLILFCALENLIVFDIIFENYVLSETAILSRSL